MPEIPGPNAVYCARKRIAPHLGRTPLVAAPALGELAGAAVHLKLETVQPTGSFKVRGAMNRVLALSAEERARGVVTASSGNHGPGLAWAAARLGVACTVCLSTMVPDNKIANVAAQGGEPHIEGKDYDEAVVVAVRLTAERNLVYVPAFDDPDIMAGAGTCGIEIVEDLPEVDSVLVPLSGGGLVAGVAI
ncbi:MAG: pyridoxal-phosphate dependent enzyme, partial [Rhodospirillaceae bacterium]|nr:pyridoxal-phosphate dependent enzyme [Rhodospirillaceae bacterium]